MSRWIPVSSLFSVLALGACTTSVELEPIAIPLHPGDPESCPAWGCTGNSPVVGPYAFHELSLAGYPNDASVSIAWVELGGRHISVELVDGRRLVGHDNGGAVYEGAALNGLTFVLDTPSGQTSLIVDRVTPKSSSDVTMWIGDHDAIETYRLLYPDPLMPSRNLPVCGHQAHSTDSFGPLAPGEPIEAVLFTGDRYEAGTKTVIATTYDEAGSWFNIGCAGSVLAKLLLTRHATASSDADHSTTHDERQALLKMYAADMCGTGQVFTLPGTPLRWENVPGWWTFDGTETMFEAFWGARGAICLDEHRLGHELYDLVQATCRLPRCPAFPSFPSDWPLDAYVKSAIPAP